MPIPKEPGKPQALSEKLLIAVVPGSSLWAGTFFSRMDDRVAGGIAVIIGLLMALGADDLPTRDHHNSDTSSIVSETGTSCEHRLLDPTGERDWAGYFPAESIFKTFASVMRIAEFLPELQPCLPAIAPFPGCGEEDQDPSRVSRDEQFRPSIL